MEQSMSKDQQGKTVEVEANLVLTEEGSCVSSFVIMTLNAGVLSQLISLTGIGVNSIQCISRGRQVSGGDTCVCSNTPGHIVGVELCSGAFWVILKSRSQTKCIPQHFFPFCQHKMCDCMSISTYRASIIMAVFPKENGF